jgi:hypothetical protein
MAKKCQCSPGDVSCAGKRVKLQTVLLHYRAMKIGGSLILILSAYMLDMAFAVGDNAFLNVLSTPKKIKKF